MPGSPRSSSTTSGWWRAASCRACSPVSARSTSYPRAREVRRHRPADRRLVVDDEHSRHGDVRLREADDHRHAAAGCVLDRHLAAHRLARTRVRWPARGPTPAPSTRWSTTRWNGWNTSSRSAGRMPGPRSITRRSTRGWPSPRPRTADTRTGTPAGREADGVADDVGQRPLEQRRIGEDVGQRLGHVELDRSGRRADAGDRRRARPPRRRPAATRCAAPTPAGGSCRAGCRRSPSAGRSPPRSSPGTRRPCPAASRRRAGAGWRSTP